MKNMSLMASISVGCSIGPIMTLIHDFGTESLENIQPGAVNHGTKVFVNGNWIGINESPDELFNNLKRLRRQMDINPEGGDECVGASIFGPLCKFDSVQ